VYLKAHDPGAYVVTMGGRRYPVRGGLFQVPSDIDPLLAETFERVEEVPAWVAAELSSLGNWPEDMAASESTAEPWNFTVPSNLVVSGNFTVSNTIIDPAVVAPEDNLDDLSDEELVEKVLELVPDVDPGSVAAAVAGDRAAVLADVRERLAGQADDDTDDDEGGGTNGGEELTLADRIDAVTTHAEANELGKELGLEFEEKKPGIAAKQEALREAAAEQAEKGQSAADAA
jgi:hypothetical protein